MHGAGLELETKVHPKVCNYGKGRLAFVSSSIQVPSYALLSEICLIRLRGHLATLNTFNSNCGWLLGLCLGLVVPVQFYYPALATPSLLFLGLGWRLPESPVWLLRRGREREARRTLQWLRGREYDAEPELQERAGNGPSRSFTVPEFTSAL